MLPLRNSLHEKTTRRGKLKALQHMRAQRKIKTKAKGKGHV